MTVEERADEVGETGAFEQALEAARSHPEEEQTWDDLEQLAADEQRPDPVAALYREVLANGPSADVAELLAERAVGFHEEWFAEDSEQLVEVLERVLWIDPTVYDWAFSRLTMLHTVAERWDALLALYDKLIPLADDDDRRATWLEEAAQTAKDFASDAARAAGYLRQLLALRPDDAQLVATLERLLEREEQYGPLAEHLASRLDVGGPDTRLRLARLYLERLSREADAVTTLAPLLEDDGPEGEQAVSLLEALVADEERPADARRDALALLRTRFAAEDRITDVVGTLDAALALAPAEERLALHREAARHLLEADKPAEAFEHLASILSLTPGDAELQGELRQIGQRIGAPERVADAFVAAADGGAEARTAAGLRVEAGALYASAGQTERAQALWAATAEGEGVAPSIGADAAFRLAESCAAAGDSQGQLAALRRRASLLEEPADRRRALGGLARAAEAAGDAEAALAAWGERLTIDPSDAEALDARLALLDAGGRHAELVDALRQRLEQELPDHQRRRDMVRVARLLAEPLERVSEALETWQQVAARFGEDVEVADAVADLFEREERFEELAALLDRRVGVEADHACAVLSRLGGIRGQRLDDAAGGLDAYRRALALQPDSAAALAGVEALLDDEQVGAAALETLASTARARGDLAGLVSLMDRRMAAAPDANGRAAIALEAARHLERSLGDPAGALTAIARALLETPDDRSLDGALERLRGLTGDDATAAAALHAAAAGSEESLRRAALEGRAAELFDGLEGRSEEAFEAHAAAFAADPARVASAVRLPPLAEELGQDARALELLAAGADRREIAEARLAVAQRLGGRALYDAWVALAAHREDSLDELLAARGQAAELVEAGTADAALVVEASERLYRRGSRMVRAGRSASGQVQPEQATVESLEALVAADLAAGRAAEAAARLEDAARMPVAPERVRAWLSEAARIVRDELGDKGRAADLHREVLALGEEDAEALGALADLYEEAGRLPELLGLRQRQLGATTDVDARLALRVQIANLLTEIERAGGRVASLLANLEEVPGHAESVEALSALLLEEGRSAQLATILAEQAGKVDREQAPELWARVARMNEEPLGQVEAALDAWRRVAELNASPEALDALARLHEARGEHAGAARWLARRLEAAEPEDRLAIALRLGEAYLACEEGEHAAEVLEAARMEHPGAARPRELLLTHYRATGAKLPLARVLADAALHAEGEAVLGYAREAAALFQDELGQPAEALAVLERAVAVAPQERELALRYADALDAADRSAEARATLEGVVESFGRRRSAERADVHARLAELLHASGETDEALEALEQATKMPKASPRLLSKLGRMAREAGQPERAEKAYRALLVAARRRKKGAPLDVGVGAVLYELSALAKQGGDDAQAKELMASALEAAASDEVEAEHLAQAAIGHGDDEGALAAYVRCAENVDAGPARASALAGQASVLDTRLGRADDALSRLLEAIAEHPADADLHERARSLARRLDAAPRYAEVMETLVERCRREEDQHLLCLLLVHQGRSAEEDLGDSAKALALYRAAEATGEARPVVLGALARAARSQGEREEERAALSALVDEPEAAEAEKVEALYRLAELALGETARRDEGVDTLRSVFARAPKPRRAGEILSAAAGLDPDHDGLMGFFEEVARGTGDDGLLLDFLERRAARADASLPQLQEAVERALSLDAEERAERLLERAVAVADAAGGAARDARWALTGLAERRRAAGDLRGARVHIERLLEEADAVERRRLLLGLAAMAAEGDADLELAADTYTELLAEEPTDPELWRPLLDAFARLGRREELASLTQRLVDDLLDPDQRNEARMAQARFELTQEDGDATAADLLKAVLDEAPEHAEAAARLAELYEKSGYDDALVELYERQLDVARDHEALDEIPVVSLKLGGLLETVRREDAVDVYRAALEWVPTDRRVVSALVACLGDDADPRERLDLMERLLATAEGDEAASLTRELVESYEAQEDEEGVQRTLMLGYRARPEDAGLRMRLESLLREREDWAELAAFLALESTRLAADPDASMALLLEATRLRREQLGDAEGAAVLLREAYERGGEPSVLLELVSSREALGDHATARAELEEALSTLAPDAPLRAAVLRAHARICGSLGDMPASLAALEEAFALDPAGTAGQLIAALFGARRAAEEGGDVPLARVHVMRLVEVLAAADDRPQSRDVLADWAFSHDDDVEALSRLKALDLLAERWSDVVETTRRLVVVTEGVEQVDAALLLADAADACGQPEAARQGLETAHAAQPSDPKLTERLMALYQATGAHHELAAMLVEQAAEADEEASFELYRRAGRLLVDAGDTEAAMGPLSAALGIVPDDHQAQLALADVYIATERVAEAGELLEQAISKHTRRRSPELAELQHRMSRLAAVVEDRSLQFQWLSAALDADKNNPVVAGELALLSMELEEWDKAMLALRAVTLCRTDGPMSRAMAFLHQARIAHAKGEARRALLWARKARSEDPELEAAAEFLAELGES